MNNLENCNINELSLGSYGLSEISTIEAKEVEGGWITPMMVVGTILGVGIIVAAGALVYNGFQAGYNTMN
jgi:hypothetical protein